MPNHKQYHYRRKERDQLPGSVCWFVLTVRYYAPPGPDPELVYRVSSPTQLGTYVSVGSGAPKIQGILKANMVVVEGQQVPARTEARTRGMLPPSRATVSQKKGD